MGKQRKVAVTPVAAEAEADKPAWLQTPPATAESSLPSAADQLASEGKRPRDGSPRSEKSQKQSKKPADSNPGLNAGRNPGAVPVWLQRFWPQRDEAAADEARHQHPTQFHLATFAPWAWLAVIVLSLIVDFVGTSMSPQPTAGAYLAAVVLQIFLTGIAILLGWRRFRGESGGRLYKIWSAALVIFAVYTAAHVGIRLPTGGTVAPLTALSVVAWVVLYLAAVETNHRINRPQASSSRGAAQLPLSRPAVKKRPKRPPKSVRGQRKKGRR